MSFLVVCLPSSPPSSCVIFLELHTVMHGRQCAGYTWVCASITFVLTLLLLVVIWSGGDSVDCASKCSMLGWLDFHLRC